MKSILLVDDSLTIRSLLRRTLADMLPADVVEAPNGVEALTHIARRRFDLVILDVNMPVMDGLETLEAIRASPEHSGLRVVMLTSEKGEATVKRLVELGISDFLSKPLSQDALADRLSRIIERLRVPVPAAAPAGVAPGHRMLVVDQDPDRRHFLATVLTGHYEVTEADSAASALRVCLGPGAQGFDFVLVGAQVGLPPVEMFVAKLRGLPNLAGARVFNCVTKGEAVADKRRELFDTTLELSHVPEVFLADLERAVTGAQTPLARILLVRPTLAADIARATEQVFGMMLSCELEAVQAALPRGHGAAGDDVHAAIELATDSGVTLTLTFHSDMKSARAIAGQMVGVSPQDVQESEVLSCAAELSNILLGRLRNRLIEAGLPAQMGLPRTWTGGVAEPTAPEDPHAIDVVFTSRTLDATFEFTLL